MVLYNSKHAHTDLQQLITYHIVTQVLTQTHESDLISETSNYCIQGMELHRVTPINAQNGRVRGQLEDLIPDKHSTTQQSKHPNLFHKVLLPAGKLVQLLGNGCDESLGQVRIAAGLPFALFQYGLPCLEVTGACQ